MHDEPKRADGNDQAGGEVARGAAEKALITAPLAANHLTADFRCAKSLRVQGFFAKEYLEMAPYNYTRAFVYVDPGDPNKILGYYTLSASSMFRRWLKNKYQKLVPGGIPAPMAHLGFMGRHDGTQKGLGAALIYDAALRVSRIKDIGIWGLVLDAECDELVKKVYEPYGFTLAVNPKDPVDQVPPRLMYAPVNALLLK